jgi:hypothetical protein
VARDRRVRRERRSVWTTVTLWRRDGWRIHVVAYRVSSHARPEDPGVVYSHIANIGRMPCIVQDVVLRRTGGTRWQRDRPYVYSERMVPSVDLPKTLQPTEDMDVRIKLDRNWRPGLAGSYRLVVTAGRRHFNSQWIIVPRDESPS